MADQDIKASDPNHNAIPDELIPRFDPVYLEHFNRYNKGKLGTHEVPIEKYRKDPAKYTISWGMAKGPDVYSTTDLKCPVQGGDIAIRVYEPEPTYELRGAYINYHGGGWVFGDLSKDVEFCKRIAAEVGCVVFDVDYRLAPEYKYPTPVDDCWAAFQWIVKSKLSEYKIDPNRIAVGGASAGGHLATVVSILARDHAMPLSFQLLVVPVVDVLAAFSEKGEYRTDCPYESYEDLHHTQPLSADRMAYFAKHFLGVPRPAEFEGDWKVSPILAPSLANLAPALIYLAEMDVLYSEGIAYAKKLQEAGNEVEIAVAKGAPHTFSTHDAVLETGKEFNKRVVGALRRYIGKAAAA